MQYDQAPDMHRKYDQNEQIKGGTWEIGFLIPEEAFREAIANASVHRTLNADAHTAASLFLRIFIYLA